MTIKKNTTFDDIEIDQLQIVILFCYLPIALCKHNHSYLHVYKFRSLKSHRNDLSGLSTVLLCT